MKKRKKKEFSKEKSNFETPQVRFEFLNPYQVSTDKFPRAATLILWTGLGQITFSRPCTGPREFPVQPGRFTDQAVHCFLALAPLHKS